MTTRTRFVSLGIFLGVWVIGELFAIPLAGQSANPFSGKVPPPPAFILSVHWLQGGNISHSRYEWVEKLHKESGFWAVDIRAGIQTSYDREWARLLNYPAFGIGYASYEFDRGEIREMIGAPNALYLFGLFPILRNRSFLLKLDMAGGLSFNFQPYHPVKNPYNDLIGSSVLSYFDFGLGGVLRVSNNINLSAGVQMIHSSNGRIRTPNLGLDLLGVKFGVIVETGAQRNKQAFSDPSSVQAPADIATSDEKEALLPVKASFWNLSVAGAINSVDLFGEVEPGRDIRGPQFFAMTLAAEWQRKYGGIGAFGLGLNVMYDASLGATSAKEGLKPSDFFTFGLTLGHELFIHRLGVLTQLGLTPWHTGMKKEVRGLWYVRAGVRIRVTRQWWGLIALKTMDGAVADFVEWGLGHTIFVKPRHGKPGVPL